ncbi:hypothetical protein HOY80DRAFT_1087354 [Tuber brumale]|nr:hypothetical protein HOY80DRAFT_1087354 [Tuber brumale]
MAPKLKELQKQCRDAILEHSGKVPELIQCLKDHRNRMKYSLEDQEDPTCDPILVTQSIVGNVDNIMRDAHDALKQTLEVEGLEVREVIGELYVSNLRGLALAGLPDCIRILEEKDSRKMAEIAELNAKTTELNAKTTELTDYVSILRHAGPDYKRVRKRYLAVFKRDKLKEIFTQSDWNIIEEGNVTAHLGDAAIDALLYDGAEGLQDSYVFEALYGLHPSDVKKIAHKETTEILNLHAKVKAHRDKTGTDEFYRRFTVFIQAFKRSNPAINYLNEGFTNATGAAYWSLRECQKYDDSK